VAVGTPGDELARVAQAVAEGRCAQEGQARTGDLLDGLAEAVRSGGQEVTDEQIGDLLKAGYSEDEIFECVVAAAVRAGVTRVRTIERLLAESR
jgi:hypothetical protein